MKRSLSLFLLAGICVSSNALATPSEQLEQEEIAWREETAALSAAELAAAELYRAASDEERAEWNDAVQYGDSPTEGCYTTSFPSLEWHKVECVAAPELPMTVGNGLGYVAVASPGSTLSNAKGFFYSASGITTSSVTDSLTHGGQFSVQLNTNFFPSPACGGAVNPSVCKGWQQFVYSGTGGSNNGSGFMQYWLVNWSSGGLYTSCPSGWNTSGNSCWKNSSAVSLPKHTITIVTNQYLFVNGIVTDPTHERIIITMQGTAYQKTQTTAVTLNGQWKTAEFNVFGYANSSQANFVPGVTIQPEIDADVNISCCKSAFGGDCSGGTTAAETNNLTENSNACGTGTTGDISIRFTEYD